MSAKAKRTKGKKSTAVGEAKPTLKRVASVKPILTDVRRLILQSRGRVAQTVNAELTMLYWHIGTRIHKDILKEKRAQYGQEILQSLSAELVAEFGRGFSERNLANMVRFAEVFPDAEILQSLTAKLGVGFCFVERQKRMQIDNEDYYLDLLFYHRKLHRLVAIDLKIGDFKAADKGQMELYLAWLNRYACESGEEPPLGVILCAGKNEEHVELLEPRKSRIHVASYWKEALPKAALEKKLRDAMRSVRARLDQREEET